MVRLLNREEAKKNVEEHFKDQNKLLSDLTEYGSNLILRAIDSSKRELHDIIICGVFLSKLFQCFQQFNH